MVLGRMAAILLVLAATATSTTWLKPRRIPVKAAGAGPLFRIVRGERTGFIVRTGKIVIAPQFRDAEDFFEGLALVLTVDRKRGFIDETGRMVVEGDFGDAGGFAEGLAPVRIGGRWGYIDRAGQIVIAPRFQSAGSFSNGLATIAVWNEADCPKTPARREEYDLVYDVSTCVPPTARYGFIRKDGRIAIKPQFESATRFSEGLAAVSRDGRYGFIDPSGHTAIAPKFDNAEAFSEGLARVALEKDDEDGYGFIDRRGKLRIPAKYTQATSFRDGLARVCEDTSGCYHIDPTGRRAVDNATTYQFSDGLAVVSGPHGKTQYYVDREGRRVALYDDGEKAESK